jgi:hypothetical protein
MPSPGSFHGVQKSFIFKQLRLLYSGRINKQSQFRQGVRRPEGTPLPNLSVREGDALYSEFGWNARAKRVGRGRSFLRQHYNRWIPCIRPFWTAIAVLYSSR